MRVGPPHSARTRFRQTLNASKYPQAHVSLSTNFTLLNIPRPNADIMSAFYQKPIVDEHLSKPVDLATLEQVVKRFRVTPPR